MIQAPDELIEHLHLPTQHGLRVPYITHQDPRTGRYKFGVNDVDLTVRAIVGRLCGMCGKQLDELKVLFAADENFPTLATPEPAMHPWCAWYASRACPMLNGSMSKYGAPVDGDIAGYGYIATPGRGVRVPPPGRLAVPWYQIWVRGDYGIGIDHITRLPHWVVWKDLPELRRRRLRDGAGD